MVPALLSLDASTGAGLTETGPVQLVSAPSLESLLHTLRTWHKQHEAYRFGFSSRSFLCADRVGRIYSLWWGARTKSIGIFATELEVGFGATANIAARARSPVSRVALDKYFKDTWRGALHFSCKMSFV